MATDQKDQEDQNMLPDTNRLLGRIAGLCVTGALAMVFAAVQLQVSEARAFAATWMDRNEYDLALAIRSEGSPQKRIELLDAWNKKYPQTELRFARLELYLAAYQSTGDRAHMFEVARQMATQQPNNPVAVYWYTILTPESGVSAPEVLDTGEKAARRLLAGLDGYFGPDRKPGSVTDAEWQKDKAAVEMAAHRTLGWIAWQRGDYAAAEQEIGTCLRIDPQSAESSSWLGIVLGLEGNDKGKQAPALWELARAAAPHQQRGLPEDQRRQINTLLEHMYASYHGAGDGLDQLRKTSETSTFAPADFSIDSATEVAARKAEEELRLTNPELAAWIGMRRLLESPQGEKYFSETLRAQPLPKFKGTVIRCTPPRNPEEIVLSMTEAGSEDVILKTTKPLPVDAEKGTKISFESTAESFHKEPFGLTATVDPAKIEGWPEKSRPRPRR